jgi:hypothetical protein
MVTFHLSLGRLGLKAKDLNNQTVVNRLNKNLQPHVVLINLDSDCSDVNEGE